MKSIPHLPHISSRVYIEDSHIARLCGCCKNVKKKMYAKHFYTQNTHRIEYDFHNDEIRKLPPPKKKKKT